MKVKIKYIETQTFCPNKLGTASNKCFAPLDNKKIIETVDA